MVDLGFLFRTRLELRRLLPSLRALFSELSPPPRVFGVFTLKTWLMHLESSLSQAPVQDVSPAQDL